MHAVLALVTVALAGSVLASPQNVARHAQVAAAKQLESRDCARFPAYPDPEMAEIVYRVTLSRSKAYKVMHATFATALIESNMNNLPCGDRKSHGIFQQQPSPEFRWGTVKETMDPVHATNAFLDVLIPLYQKHPDWPPNRLAQETQQAQAGDQYFRTLDRAENLISATKGKYELKLAKQKAEALAKAKAKAAKEAAAKAKASSIASVKSASAAASSSSVASVSASLASAKAEAERLAAQQKENDDASLPLETGAPGAKNVAQGPGKTGGEDNAGVRTAVSGFALIGALLVAAMFS